MHPGAKEEQKFGVSVRRNTYGIGQTIDLGEQTYMKSSTMWHYSLSNKEISGFEMGVES